MKEAFEDRITRRIKEVVEQYEPEYSPQDWEDFRKQKLLRGSWLSRFFMRFRYWFTGITLTGILIIVLRIFYPSLPEKESDVIPLNSDSVRSSESINYPESKRINEVSVPERLITSSQVDSKADTTSGKGSISFNYLPVLINDSLSANYDNKIQIENGIPGIPDSIEIVPARSDLLREEGLGNQFNNLRLIPLELKTIKVPSLTSPASDSAKMSELQLTGFSSLAKGSNNQNKPTGPNKFSLFYSPELHLSDSIINLGISHGFGIKYERQIIPSISVSAGLSYQSMSFSRIIFDINKYGQTIIGYDIDTIGGGQCGGCHETYIYNPIYKTILHDSIGIKTGRFSYLELPVSVNIKLFEGARSQVWLGTGISSIAFLSQDYSYETIVANINRRDTIHTNAWKDIHAFASLNFNLLYQIQLSNHFFFFSSMHYRIHLEDLGSNSMKLNRLNLQVGLGYRFGRYD